MSRILMIEDHPTNRRLIGDILRGAGHDVREASTADEGIPMAIAEQPDLILMDIQLPGMDGLAATRLLRRDERTQRIPILAVTAHAMRGDENRILAAGCDGYVAKPISYKKLLEQVSRFTGQSQSPTHAVPDRESSNTTQAPAGGGESTHPDWPSVLVVDDEPGNVALLNALLSRHGYVVRTASSGAECLALAPDADLILLDAMMPDLDGFEVLRRLRADPVTRVIPVVMITALQSSEDRLRAVEAGCDEFLTKPFDLNEVVARVRTLVRLNYYRRQLDEKAKLESVVRQMGDGIVICDARWMVLISNQTAAAYLGQAVEGARSPLDLIYEGYVATVPRDEVAALAYRRMKFELRRAASDRFQELVLEATVEVLRDVEHAPTSVVMTLRDVTAVYLQGVLRQEFLSLISHKLRTPLTVLSMHSSLLLDEQLSSNPEVLRTAAKAVEIQTNRLHQLVEKLIQFTLVSDVGLRTPSDSVSLARHVPAVVERIVKSSGRPVDVRLQLSDVSVAASASNITALVENLVDNAVKFCEKDRVALTISAVQQGTNVVLTIADNGPGIPPEERASIFEKFYQIEKHFTGSVEGIGLGLALVKSIVEAHGGRIEIDSEINKGSKFVVTLPCRASEETIVTGSAI